MKKSLFSILLMLLPVVASNAYDELINGIYYNFDDDTGTAEVTSGNSKYTGDVVIPDLVTSSHGTYIVTSIGDDAFYRCPGLKSVTIPATVTSIGDGAFDSCYGLTSVDIPNSVTSIGRYAFQSCTGLTSVSIPNSVTSIGYEAFDSCTGLTSVDIPNSVTSIGSYAFYSCSALETVAIHNPETSLGRDVFYGTKWLNSQPDGLVYLDKILYGYKGTMPDNTSIVIKEGTLAIAGGAFYDCSGLTSVTIPNSVTSIGDNAFQYCSGLTSVTIGNSVTSIGYETFDSCTGLTSVDIPNSVTSIDTYAFWGCKNLTSVTIPNSVKSIGPSAFSGCSSLTSITIPSSVTSIERYTFYKCTNLSSVTIPSSVKSIGASAFYSCSGLKSIDIPGSVTSIGNRAFSYCTGLEKVTIGDGIKLIGYNAFGYCNSFMIDMYCYAEEVPNADKDAFYNSGSIQLRVPAQSVEAYRQVKPWSDCWAIIDDDMDIEKCAKPTINFTNGKLSFSSATEGAVFVYDIETTGNNKVGAGEEVTLKPTCIVSVVATKPGYSNSEPATAELDLSGSGINGDLNADGNVDAVDITKLIEKILK